MALQFGGGDMTLPTIQTVALVLGSVGVWRLGGKIIEGMTRIYTETARLLGDAKTGDVEATRYYGDVQAGLAFVQQAQKMEALPKTHRVFCYYCGEPMPSDAAFCRRCGRKQEHARTA
jgi:ribosomal protein L40E